MGEAKVGGGSLNRVGSGSNMDNYAAGAGNTKYAIKEV